MLFAYWFRYHCLLVLKSKPDGGHAVQVARANDLTFPEVQECLERRPASGQLPALRDTLLREYDVLTCLLRYSNALDSASGRFDQRVLMLDFRLMQACFALTHRLLPVRSSYVLEECAHILVYFAEALGERTAAVR